MNILIENADAAEYRTGNGEWNPSPTAGKCFSKTGAAFDFAKKEAIGKFNIVGYITDTEQFINLHHGRGKGLAEVVVPA